MAESFVAPVVVVSTANRALTGLPTVDGVTLTAGQRILLTGQTTASSNGVWTVASGAWSRPSDFPSGGTVDGTFVVVTSGTSHAFTVWGLQGVVKVDTDVETWVQPGRPLSAPPPTGIPATDYAVLQALVNTGYLRLGYAPETNPYVINQTLTVPEFATIEGLGTELSVIKQASLANLPVVIATIAYMTGQKFQPVYFRDFAIDVNPSPTAQTAATDGLVIMNLRSHIERVRVLNPAGNGITISDESIDGSFKLSDAVLDCIIRGCRVDFDHTFLPKILSFTASTSTGPGPNHDPLITISGTTSTGSVVGMPVLGQGVPPGTTVTVVDTSSGTNTVLTVDLPIGVTWPTQASVVLLFPFANRGFWVRSDPTAAQKVTDCYFEGNISNGAWGDGCAIESADGWFIRGNLIQGSLQCGMRVAGAFVGSVQDNHIDGFAQLLVSPPSGFTQPTGFTFAGLTYIGLDVTGLAQASSYATPLTCDGNEVNTREVASGTVSVNYVYFNFHHLPGDIGQTVTFGVNNAWRDLGTTVTPGSATAFQFIGPPTATFHVKGGNLLTTQGDFSSATNGQPYSVASGHVAFLDGPPDSGLASTMVPDYLAINDLVGAMSDPAACSATITLAVTTLYLARVVLHSTRIGVLVAMVQTAGGGAGTGAVAGIFDPITNLQVATVTGIDTALRTAGTANMTLSTALTGLPPLAEYYVALWIPSGWGTPLPVLRTVPANVAAVNARSPFRTATVSGVMSFPSTLPTLTAPATGPWLGIG
jgi:hypothetical protein